MNGVAERRGKGVSRSDTAGRRLLKRVGLGGEHGVQTMFYRNTAFNTDIGDWNTSRATDMWVREKTLLAALDRNPQFVDQIVKLLISQAR